MTVLAGSSCRRPSGSALLLVGLDPGSNWSGTYGYRGPGAGGVSAPVSSRPSTERGGFPPEQAGFVEMLSCGAPDCVGVRPLAWLYCDRACVGTLCRRSRAGLRLAPHCRWPLEPVRCTIAIRFAWAIHPSLPWLPIQFHARDREALSSPAGSRHGPTAHRPPRRASIPAWR